MSRQSGPILHVPTAQPKKYILMCPDCHKGSGRMEDGKRCKTCQGRGRVTQELIHERAVAQYELRQSDFKELIQAIEAIPGVTKGEHDWIDRIDYWFTGPNGTKHHIEVKK